MGVGGGIREHAALRAGRRSRPASAPMPSRRYVHSRRRTARRDGARGDDNVVFEKRVVDDDARASPPRREEARQREVDADALPTTKSACQHHEQEQRRQRYADLFRSPPHEVAAGAAAGAASPRRWRRALAAALMTGACAVAQLCHPAAAARAKSAASAPADLHTPAASFNLPVPPSADFKLTEFEFDLMEPERRKLATPPHRRQRKKMNAFVREAAERVGPCVVRIDVDFGGGRGGGGGAWRGHGQGCGLVFDSDAGLVITNAHVVEGKGRVVVTFTDGRVYGGCVIGSDALTDIALVRIEPRPDHTLPRVPPVGDSSTLEVGDWVIALGNPFGLDNTITLGIVSNLHRTSAELGIPDRRVDFLQTDCAINPGNSGGPLVNEFGEVVAINTAIRADAEGIGFAIPINDVQRVVKLLAAGQRVQHPFIGIQMVTLAPRAHLAGAGETNGSGGGGGGVRSESAGAGSARGGGAGDDDVSDALDAKAGAAASSPEASSSSSSSAAATPPSPVATASAARRRRRCCALAARPPAASSSSSSSSSRSAAGRRWRLDWSFRSRAEMAASAARRASNDSGA